MSHHFSYLKCAFAILLATSPALKGQERNDRQPFLVITYSCEPANRPVFRSYMEKAGVMQFEQWRKEGRLSSYLILFSPDVNDDTWDMMVMVGFERYGQMDRWKEIERTRPGGLSQDALKLASPANTYEADLAWHGEATGPSYDPHNSVYFVRPYDYVDRTTYEQFFDAYNRPQFDAWLRKGVIKSYRVFLNQHQTGKPWDVLIVYEYAGLEGLSQRDAVKDEVGAEMKGIVGWSLLGSIKGAIRSSGRITLGDPILPQ